MFPDFLIIGAQKAGTTWLYRNLLNHPQIWMPKEKELHYFDERMHTRSSVRDKLFGKRTEDQRWRRHLRRQLGSYKKKFSLKNVAWDLGYFLRTPSDDWYASLFRQGRGKITGETTPDYSVLDRDAVAHVHRIMPQAKIIFIMRNPIERAWSQAMMERIRGRPLDEVPDEEFLKHFASRRSRLFSDYLRTLKNWGAFYPEERIFAGFLEDVHFYPNHLLHRVYRFLGADVSMDYPVIRRKVHTRKVETMPTRLAAELAVAYRGDLERLAGRFGGYADFWLYCADRLAEDPPRERSMPYPLWESSLWQDWAGAGEEPFDPSWRNLLQSAPLDAL